MSIPLLPVLDDDRRGRYQLSMVLQDSLRRLAVPIR